VPASEDLADKESCDACGSPIPNAQEHCPHCGRPGVFPNVRQASRPAEVRALGKRYESAVKSAAARGLSAQAQSLESAVARSSAVISRSLNEALRLGHADDQGYATYYQLLHAEARFPEGNEWDRLRQLADVELFGIAAKAIRFALLSLNERGLPHYGDVSLVLEEKMVAHRATVFEENSAVFFQRCRSKGEEPPCIQGFRARWEERSRLAVAKHEPDLTGQTRMEWTRIVALPGKSAAEDVFLEVHVYGSLTRRSLRKVVLRKVVGQSPALVQELRDRLSEVHVKVEEDQ